MLRTTAVQFYTAGNGNGTIWLDDVACNGQENRLDYCNHIGWSVHNCGHHEDVGIRCYGGYSFLEGITLVSMLLTGTFINTGPL